MSTPTQPLPTGAATRLFEPLQAGALKLKNRLVMAPLTRVRSGNDGIPDADVVEYYRQRASFGAVITEGTWPAITGRGYAGQPGIATDEQIAAWRKVTDAVHADGGTIVMQLMHAGRNSNTSLTGGAAPEAPSSIDHEGYTHDLEGNRLPFPTPQAMDADGLQRTKQEFVQSAANAMKAGFDGVELHGANGYYLHEFLAPSSNTRTDEYGGSPANRARFVIEVATAVAEEIGGDRVGLRISPEHNIQDVIESDPEDVRATYFALLKGLAPLKLAFLSVLHADAHGQLVADLRERFDGTFMLNNGFGPDQTTREEAFELIDSDVTDAVVVGRPAISNPDLVRRWREGHDENPTDASTFYTKGPHGLTDYPFLDD